MMLLIVTMAQSSLGRSGRPVSRWGSVTQALLGGLTVASAGFFLITVMQPAGLDPPPQTAALFLVSMTAAAISYILLTQELHRLGYTVGILTGFWVIGSVALVVSGTYGPPGPETNPIGPIAWVLLSLAVIVTAVFARRES